MLKIFRLPNTDFERLIAIASIAYSTEMTVNSFAGLMEM